MYNYENKIDVQFAREHNILLTFQNCIYERYLLFNHALLLRVQQGRKGGEECMDNNIPNDLET